LQVALMQNSLTLSQELHGLEAEKQYWLQFYYNARAGDFARPTLTARIDGEDIVVLEAIESVGDSESYHFINVPFVPASDSTILQLESFVEEGGDGTVLLDGLTVTRRDSGEIVVVNPSFEASGVAPAPGYLQPALVAGWVIEGSGYGMNRPGEGPFADNGTNPDQDLVLFLQGMTNAAQVVQGLTLGQTYSLQFAYNARGGNTPQLIVVVDDVAVFDEVVAPVGDAASYHQASVTFTAKGESASIAFGQVAEGDQTILLDDIHVLGGAPDYGALLPRLDIANIDGNRVELSWSNAFTEFLLETGTDLQTWADATQAVTDRDGRFVVTVTRDATVQFYRLAKR
jgi:hypothetical protein